MMRRAMSLALPLALCAGCADETELLSDRPEIAATTPQCSIAEVVSIDRPMRFVSMDEGRFGIWGTRPRIARENVFYGSLIIADPASGEAPHEIGIDLPVASALTWHDGEFYISRDRPVIHRFAEDATGWLQNHYTLLPTTHREVSPDLHVTDDEDVIVSFRATVVDRFSGIARLGDRDEVVWIGGLIDGRGFPLFDSRVVGFTVSGKDVITTGIQMVGRDEPGNTSFIERLDLSTGRSSARWLGPRDQVEPMRIVQDRAGLPVLLGLEGHSGDRYQRGRPFAAYINPNAELVDRHDIALPDDASHGAVLAAVQLEDGWLYGGSACGAGRAWCDAWLQRTRGDEVVWTRRLTRSVAATVKDLRVEGDRVVALVGSSRYCCEFQDFDHDAWLWELDLDGECQRDTWFEPDGVVFR